MTTLINTTTRFAFYQISRQATQVTIRFGRIGSRGQAKKVQLADRRSAKDFVVQKLEEKTARNYVPLLNNSLPRTLVAQGTSVWMGR